MDIDDMLTSSSTHASMNVLGSSSSASASASAAATAAALTELSEVSVRFVTRNASLPQVPHTFLSVPVRLARYGLSEIVNALTQTSPPRPFDFLIGGRFLRGSLLAHLTRTGSGGESGLELEYVEAMPEPQSEPSRPHPDWIAAIDARAPGGRHLLTACYDSVVRVYDTEDAQGPALATGVGHTSAVKSVAAFRLAPGAAAAAVAAAASASSAAAAGAGFRLVTGSKDRSVRVWSYTPGQTSLRCVAQCVGHTDSVEAVVTAPGSNIFASGGWDQTVRVWDVSNPDTAVAADADAAAAPAAKKRKGSASAAPAAVPSFSPLLTLTGHVGAVTSLVCPHPAALYSGSMDHHLKQWDISSSKEVRTWFSTRPINSVAFATEANVLATAHSDGAIRVWDPRAQANAKAAVLHTLTSHKAWCSSISFAPSAGAGGAQQLASVAYDSTVKIWDLRSALPLSTIRSHTDKLLAVDWASSSTVVSGGADKKLQTHTIGKAHAEADSK